MNLSEHILIIGACGWQHTGWVETFYPGDLPVEWQLGYYGNEYPVVLIPAFYWQRADMSVAQWLEETDRSPLFVSEWPDDSVAQARAREGMKLLGVRGLGFVVPLVNIPAPAELPLYMELLAAHALVFDITSLSVQAQAQVQTVLNHALGENTFGMCWHGEADSQDRLALGPLALTRISSVKDPRELRRIIETNIAHSKPGRKMVLIVDGDPPDIQLIENAGIMLDLL